MKFNLGMKSYENLKTKKEQKCTGRLLAKFSPFQDYSLHRKPALRVKYFLLCVSAKKFVILTEFSLKIVGFGASEGLSIDGRAGDQTLGSGLEISLQHFLTFLASSGADTL